MSGDRDISLIEALWVATVVVLAFLTGYQAGSEPNVAGSQDLEVEIIEPLVIQRTDPYDPSSATVYVP